MTTPEKSRNTLVLSFLSLRRVLGVLGMGLPFLLYLGGLAIYGVPLLSSVSAYYHSPARDILVGTLCAIGVFLLCYRGFEPLPGERLTDRRVSFVAGLGALGVAFLPTRRTCPEEELVCAVLPCRPVCGHEGACPDIRLSSLWSDLACTENTLWALHVVATVLFLGALAVMALVNFRRTGPLAPSPDKIRRNRVYALCGTSILVFGVLAGWASFMDEDSFYGLANPVFWFEAGAVFFFGVAWFVKGEVLENLPRLGAWFGPEAE